MVTSTGSSRPLTLSGEHMINEQLILGPTTFAGCQFGCSSREMIMDSCAITVTLWERTGESPIVQGGV